MKKIIFVAAVFLGQIAHAAEVKTSGMGETDLDRFAGKTISVQFESSPKLTFALREQFEAMGYKLTETVEQADVVIVAAAAFGFQKPRARAQEVDFGKVVEQTKGDLIAQKDSQAYRDPKFDLAPAIQSMRGNLSTNMVLGAGVVETISSLIGVRSWFNKLVGGDERGICLGTEEMCKDWKKYDQRMRMGAMVTFKGEEKIAIRAEATTKDEQLLPDQLFKAGMGELTKRLFTAKSAQPIAANRDAQSPVGADEAQRPLPAQLPTATGQASGRQPLGAFPADAGSK